MYNRTFWQDHVTEFGDRFREQNNPDGTVTHIPVEGEVIQEGTPQNAANFNNIEMGIFAANEIAAELARITLRCGSATGETSGGSSGGGLGGGTDSSSGGGLNGCSCSHHLNFTLPVSAWEQLEEPRNDYKQYAEINVEGFTKADSADVIFSFDCFETLKAAGVSPGGDPEDGKVIVYAETVPEEEITGIVVVYKKGGE